MISAIILVMDYQPTDYVTMTQPTNSFDYERIENSWSLHRWLNKEVKKM